jgi:hypothetical protein
MEDITIIIPEQDDDYIYEGLVKLTEELHKRGVEVASGFLGGEFGYGACFENEVFMMHPYCWCEQDNCAWCSGENGFDNALNQGQDINRCAPNFNHKPSNLKIWWYKYIGRGMEYNRDVTPGEFDKIIKHCLESDSI